MRNPSSSTRTRVARAAALVAAGLVGLVLAGPASADSWRDRDDDTIVVHHYDDDRDWRPRHHRAVGHRPRVVHVYHHYRNPPPVVVHHERVYREPAHYAAPTQRAGAFTAQSLIGAAIGGLVGSQIGGGDGNRAATAAGAVTGLLIGSRVR